MQKDHAPYFEDLLIALANECMLAISTFSCLAPADFTLSKVTSLRASILSIIVWVASSTPSFGAVMDFEGTLGKQPIGLSFEAPSVMGSLPPGPVRGVYFYKRYLKDIPLEGDLDSKGNIVLYELDSKHQKTALIKGVLNSQEENLTGTWSKLDGTGALPLSAHSGSMSGGTLEQRYLVAGVEMSNDAFESKVKTFLSAVAANDKLAVASAVAFPLNANHGNSHRVFKNRAQFLANYDQIFTARFRAVLKDCVPHNMFARDQGVMLGTGQVWFNEIGKAYTLNY